MNTPVAKRSLADRIGAKKALEAFSRLSDANTIIESDRLGPKLWDIARKAVIAGMVAVTALTAASPAFAGPLKLPTLAQAEAYLADANNAVVSVGDPEKTEGYTGIVGDPSSPFRTRNATTFSDGPCVVGFAPASNDAYHYKLINLPKGADLTPLMAMKGITECLLRATDHLSGKNNSHGRYVSDAFDGLVAALAAAKYGNGPNSYKALIELEASKSLVKVLNGTEKHRADALGDLEALGSLGKFLDENPGALAKLKAADVSALPEMARAFAAHASLAVSKTDIHPDALYHIGQHAAAGKLAEEGLAGASWAAKLVAGNGLVNDDICGNTNLNNGNHKNPGDRNKLCPLRKATMYPEEDAEVQARYGKDVGAHLESLLSRPEQAAALGKRP